MIAELNVSLISSTTTLEQLNDEKVLPKIPAMVLVIALMVLGVVGNAVTCYVFGYRLRQCPTNFFMLVLALFDMLSCCITMPTDIVDIRFPLMFPSDVACRILRFITFFTSGSSAFILLALALDRYRRVCRPHAPQLSIRQAKGLSLFFTLVALGVTCPVFYLTGNMTTPTRIPNITGIDCALSDSVKSTSFPSIYLAILLSIIVLLFFIIFVCYLLLWLQVRRLFSSSEVNDEISRSRSATNLMVFLITVLFVLSYFPCLVLMIERAVVSYDTAMSLTSEVFHSIGINSYALSYSLNPVIYYLCHKRFKAEVRSIFSFRKIREKK